MSTAVSERGDQSSKSAGCLLSLAMVDTIGFRTISNSVDIFQGAAMTRNTCGNAPGWTTQSMTGRPALPRCEGSCSGSFQGEEQQMHKLPDLSLWPDVEGDKDTERDREGSAFEILRRVGGCGKLASQFLFESWQQGISLDRQDADIPWFLELFTWVFAA